MPTTSKSNETFQRRPTVKGNISLLAALLILVLASVSSKCGAQAAAKHSEQSGQVIWSGASGGYRWKWTTADLTATNTGSKSVLFSALGYEKRTSQMFKDEKTDPFDSLVECRIKLLSIVGAIACYERDYYWEGGAHPSGSIDCVVVDAGKADHLMSLTDVFKDSDILNALMADKIVRETLERNKITEKPQTSAELVKLLSGKTFGDENNMRYGFEPNLLNRFAFHHIQGNRVAIRINISWASEIYRFTSTQIGILLPIPAKLKSALIEAEKGKHGFLMRDAAKLSNGRETLLFSLKGK